MVDLSFSLVDHGWSEMTGKVIVQVWTKWLRSRLCAPGLNFLTSE